MTRTLIGGTALAALLAAAIPASADTLLGSYIARLSDNDHYASDGYKLDTAAQVVRQDRANWHRFNRGDAEDEDDPWFGSADARARYESLLNKSGAIDQATRRAILGGEPVIEVQVYRNSVRVDILGY
ncbi:MAG: hypothetical protein KF849_00995 [Rhizobiaceae bacterium]|nr:hypothetical protein [Rhizobiaceae bacterium]